MNLLIRAITFSIIFSYIGIVNADYKDDIAFTQLAAELGLNLPDGNNVIATQIEAATSYVDHDNNSSTADLPVYLPDPNNSAFSGKLISDMTGAESGTYSSHANGVGGLFYGNNSMASGINTIHAHWADYWLEPGFLNYGNGKPSSSSSRIANHSWVGTISDLTVASNILRRIDWVIETDEFLQIVGIRNSISINYNLLSAAYNVLAVGKTDGKHSTGSPFVDSTYPSGRIRTEIVAPFGYTSSSTPAVSAAASLLVDLGHSNPALSTDPAETSTSNRDGNTIFNAERSEVIKATLLAGADRLTQNTSTIANITDYRVDATNQTSNGLDARFGAGQVNVYNSYHIVAAGEQNSSQDGGAGSTGIATFGFDYDPSFGGENNNVASYYFTTGATPEILSASLVWHIYIDGGNGPNFSGTAAFYDLDLYLYDITESQTLLISSTSQIDNSENIWTSLSANRNYLLQVIPKAGQSYFDWDYALAWRLASDLDGDGITDHQDNCPVNSNANQADMDNDEIGDACDSDIDGDGTPNLTDAFPWDPTETTDTDGDSIGNNTDDDDDDDGLTDVTELSIGTDPLLVDTDDDGFSDYDEVNAGSDPLDIASVPVTADGDLNNDSVVDVRDILLGQQILMGLTPLTADHLAHGDVAPLISGTSSPNGLFNLGDFVIIQQKVLGIINF
jgi:hypothetical protein